MILQRDCRFRTLTLTGNITAITSGILLFFPECADLSLLMTIGAAAV
nr:hypothetical protein [Evansella caseinilytica]